jgi:hypothetical protein
MMPDMGSEPQHLGGEFRPEPQGQKWISEGKPGPACI